MKYLKIIIKINKLTNKIINKFNKTLISYGQGLLFLLQFVAGGDEGGESFVVLGLHGDGAFTNVPRTK